MLSIISEKKQGENIGFNTASQENIPPNSFSDSEESDDSDARLEFSDIDEDPFEEHRLNYIHYNDDQVEAGTVAALQSELA